MTVINLINLIIVMWCYRVANDDWVAIWESMEVVMIEDYFVWSHMHVKQIANDGKKTTEWERRLHWESRHTFCKQVTNYIETHYNQQSSAISTRNPPIYYTITSHHITSHYLTIKKLTFLYHPHLFSVTCITDMYMLSLTNEIDSLLHKGSTTHYDA